MSSKQSKNNKNTSQKQVSFPLIAIGASINSQEAFQKIIKDLPPDLNTAYILVQHLAPNVEDNFASILGKHTTLEIIRITDGLPIQPNKIFVSPQGKLIGIQDGSFTLAQPEKDHDLNHPIDQVFFSIAETVKDLSFGVIFSCVDDDGIAGLERMNQVNGYTISQYPSILKSYSLPLNTICLKVVDCIVDLDDIASQIISYVRTLYSSNKKALEQIKCCINENQLKQIFGIIKMITGHEFSFYKKNITTIRFEVVPIKRHPVFKNLLWIIFQDYIIPPGSGEPNTILELLESGKDRRIYEMEKELMANRMYPQTTIVELGYTNDELTTLNEEAKSLKEELGLSKEELYTVNEKLTSLNAEYHQSIEALRILNNDIHNFIRNAQAGILFLDRELCVVRFSPAIRSIVELIDTDIGRPLNTFITTLKDHDLFKRCQQVLDTLLPIEEEVKTRHQKIFLERIQPYRTLNDKVEGVVLVFLDITKQLTAEHSLCDSETKYRLLYQSMHDAFVRLDLEGRITECNSAYLELVGYTFEEVVGLKNTAMMPDRRDKFEERYLSEVVMAKGYSDVYEIEYCRKDGQIIPVELRTFVLKDEKGIKIGFWSIVRDITERKQAEKNLLQKQEQYESFVRNFQGIAFQVHAKTLEPLMYSGDVFKITGYTPQDFLNSTIKWNQLVHPHDQAQLKIAEERILKDPDFIIDHEYRIIRNDGEIKFVREIAQIVSINDKEIPILQGAIYDITEQKAIMEELQKQEKLESIGVLAGGIAHDFNNLLAGIFGYIDIAAENIKGNNSVSALDNLSRALSVYNRACELTQQLLTFAKGGAPVKQVVNLSSLIREVVHFSISGTNVRSDIKIAPDLWLCEADLGQINQVINNLIINAQQAMPAGGIIHVIADNIYSSDLPAGLQPDALYISISISDTGTGIAPEYLTRIFEPFFTTKQKGNGLGLATSHSIIQKHKGTITVKSELGMGTTFTLYLPADPALVPNQNRKEKYISLKGQGKVLVMDDEKPIQIITRHILEKMGFTVDCTDTAEKTLEKAFLSIQQSAPYTIAILDLTIPGGRGGKECLNDLRRIIPNLKIIATSGYSDNQVISLPKDFGFDASLSKPFRKDDLARIIRSLSEN